MSKTKVCTKCKTQKPVSEFHKSKRCLDGLNCWCKDCKYKNDKYWRDQHKKEQKRRHDKYYAEKGHKTARLRLYGVSPDDYDSLYKAQKGCCAICGTHQSQLPKALGIDHNHVSKKIRGLLCYKCNLGLGYFSDNKELVGSALLYLERYEAT